MFSRPNDHSSPVLQNPLVCLNFLTFGSPLNSLALVSKLPRFQGATRSSSSQSVTLHKLGSPNSEQSPHKLPLPSLQRLLQPWSDNNDGRNNCEDDATVTMTTTTMQGLCDDTMARQRWCDNCDGNGATTVTAMARQPRWRGHSESDGTATAAVMARQPRRRWGDGVARARRWRGQWHGNCGGDDPTTATAMARQPRR